MNEQGFDAEIAGGKRFAFGRNWSRFLETLTDSRIEHAERSTIEMLGLCQLSAKTFLDIGSGSGLFSLVAHRLGATVHSFDYDPSSVECTRQVRDLHTTGDNRWHVERGSALDRSYMESLGQFDIVYAWGVLHHTGDLWTSLEYAANCVRTDGLILLAIYNDAGRKSALWRRIKRVYCSGFVGRTVVVGTLFPYSFIRMLIRSCLSRQNLFASYRLNRGMSLIRDWHDWCGGLPYEVASVETVFRFFSERGFVLRNIRTTNGRANNQFLFQAVRSESKGSADATTWSFDDRMRRG